MEHSISLPPKEETAYYLSSYEQLVGVEAYERIAGEFPMIYTRLLESLQRSSLLDELINHENEIDIEKINDNIIELELEFSDQERSVITKMLLDAVVGLGPIEPLLTDAKVSDILVNRYDQIFVETEGRLQLTRLSFVHENQLLSIIHRILAKTNTRVDRLQPYTNTRLADGSRVNVIIPPASTIGPVVSIRRFNRLLITMEELIANGSINQEMALLLELAIKSHLNIIIIGGAGAGKTTLLNIMARYILAEERILIIEDVRELDIQHPHVIQLESRTESIEGIGKITIRDLFINALRMRPTRIMIGEVRGLEILEMLQAMNSGHDGTIATLHASSPENVYYRILNLISIAGINIPSHVILDQLINSLDVIVEIQRLPSGHRIVKRITECVKNRDSKFQLHDIYAYKEHTIQGKKVEVNYQYQGTTPHLIQRAKYYGLDHLLALM